MLPFGETVGQATPDPSDSPIWSTVDRPRLRMIYGEFMVDELRGKYELCTRVRRKQVVTTGSLVS